MRYHEVPLPGFLSFPTCHTQQKHNTMILTIMTLKRMWVTPEISNLSVQLAYCTTLNWTPDPDGVWCAPSHYSSGTAGSSPMVISVCVCEAGQSLSCNNVTGEVDCIHAFNTAGGADVQLQLFTASSLHGIVFKFTFQQLYTRRLNHRHLLN